MPPTFRELHSIKASMRLDRGAPIVVDTALDPPGDETPTPHGPDLWVLDGLTYGWDAASEQWPTHPNPSTLQWSVLCPSVDDLPPLERGELVVLELDGRVNTGTVSAPFIRTDRVLNFAGRLTDASLTLRRDGRVQVSVVAASLDVDLAELYIGDEPWDDEYGPVRFDRIELAIVKAAKEAGVELANATGPHPFDGRFHQVDVDRRPALEVLWEHCRQAIVLYTPQTKRKAPQWAVLMPAVELRGAGNVWDPNGTPTLVYRRYEDQAMAPLLRVTATGGVATLTAVDVPESLFKSFVYPASLTGQDVTVVKAPGRDVTRVLVTGAFSEEEAGAPTTTAVVATRDPAPGRQARTEEVSSSLYTIDRALLFAESLLGEDVEHGRGWHLDRVAVELRPHAGEPTASMNHAQQMLDPNGLGGTYVIDGFRDTQKLTGKRWTAGQLAGVELAVNRRRMTASLKLRPNVPRPATPGGVYTGALTYAQLKAAFTAADAPRYRAGAGVVNVIDPALTYLDFRLATA